MRLRFRGGKPTESARLYGLAGALMLGGPVGRELYVNHYPAQPEAFLIPLIAAALGATIAIVSRVAGGLLGAIVFGGLLFIFADMQFDLDHYTYTAGVLAACIVLALLLAHHRAAIFAASLGAFFLSSAFRPAKSPRSQFAAITPATSSGPALVHVVLDEQLGIGGLRAEGDSVTADFLTNFYLDRGFEVFEGAYSRYDMTDASLPIAFSLGQSPSFKPNGRTPLGGQYHKTMRRTPYFERLHELGYDLRVYQSTYIDFCSGVDVQVATCDVQQASSIANIGFLGGSWLTRATLAGQIFLTTKSHVYAKVKGRAANCCLAGAGGGIAVLQRLTSDIAAREAKSTAYVVHALLPHRPIQVDEECRVLSDPSRQIGYAHPDHRNDSLWQVALDAYAGQVRCAHRMIDRVIAAVDSTVGRDNAIIMIHGDHGSRMFPKKPLRESLDAYAIDELNRVYATLLAIRRPHVAPSLHQYPVPIQDAIWELARSGFRDSLSGPWQHELRSNPDSLKEGFVRPLTKADMVWVRQKN